MIPSAFNRSVFYVIWMLSLNVILVLEGIQGTQGYIFHLAMCTIWKSGIQQQVGLWHSLTMPHLEWVSKSFDSEMNIICLYLVSKRQLHAFDHRLQYGQPSSVDPWASLKCSNARRHRSWQHLAYHLCYQVHWGQLPSYPECTIIGWDKTIG